MSERELQGHDILHLIDDKGFCIGSFRLSFTLLFNSMNKRCIIESTLILLSLCQPKLYVIGSSVKSESPDVIWVDVVQNQCNYYVVEVLSNGIAVTQRKSLTMQNEEHFRQMVLYFHTFSNDHLIYTIGIVAYDLKSCAAHSL